MSGELHFQDPWILALLVLLPVIAWWRHRRRAYGALTYSAVPQGAGGPVEKLHDATLGRRSAGGGQPLPVGREFHVMDVFQLRGQATLDGQQRPRSHFQSSL